MSNLSNLDIERNATAGDADDDPASGLVDALTQLTNGFKYSTEVCGIARHALALYQSQALDAELRKAGLCRGQP